MFPKNASLVIAAATAASQSGGPAAALLCDSVVQEMNPYRTAEGLSEHEILLARAEAALRAQKQAARKPLSLPRLNLRALLTARPFFRRPRLAA